jgi:hypothetical protein
MGYEAFVIDDQTREMLLEHFPPSFPDVIAHHVTNRFGVKREDNRPFGEQFVLDVVGIARREGLEALVISRVNSTVRPDGGTYHMTWSLDRSLGVKPADSNELVDGGWDAVPPVRFSATFEYLN